MDGRLLRSRLGSSASSRRDAVAANVCAKCNKVLADLESAVQCSACKRYYHGRSCCDLNSKKLRSVRAFPKASEGLPTFANLVLRLCSSDTWICAVCNPSNRLEETRSLSPNAADSSSSQTRQSHVRTRNTQRESQGDAQPAVDNRTNHTSHSANCNKKAPLEKPHVSAVRETRKHGLASGQSSRSHSPLEKKFPKLAFEPVTKAQQLSVEPPALPVVCPTPSCQGLGHLSGIYNEHSTIETCPLYHNLTPEYCKKLYEERSSGGSSKSNLRFLRYAAKDQQHAISSLETSRKVLNTRLRDSQSEQTTQQLATWRKDREEFGRTREPRLDLLAVDEDLGMFRQAQSLLAEDLEKNPELYVRTNNFIRVVRFGKYEMQALYPSPYPEGMEKYHKLFICEFCLKYCNSEAVLKRHKEKCVWLYPPGDEIYRKDSLSVWEVDGKKCKFYCQNLCLLAKLFLDHKTLYFDVEPFLFYVLTVAESNGCNMIGYFSKEKKSAMNCNLSCILTLPPFQNRGFGRFLIEFSYLLSLVEEKIGSPERPLSDLGLISYRKFWSDVITEKLSETPGRGVSIKELSQETGIHTNDIVSTLEFVYAIKYWKGDYFVCIKEDMVKACLARSARRTKLNLPRVDSACLHWKPQRYEANASSQS